MEIENSTSASVSSELSDESNDIQARPKQCRHRKPSIIRKAILVGVPMETFVYKQREEIKVPISTIRITIDRKKQKKAKSRKALFIEPQTPENFQVTDYGFDQLLTVPREDPIIDLIKNHGPSSFDIISRGSLPGIKLCPLL